MSPPNGWRVAAGYLKNRGALITVHEAEQLFDERWRDHEAALLFAFERRFQLVEARMRALVAGTTLDEAAFLDESVRLVEDGQRRAEAPTASLPGLVT